MLKFASTGLLSFSKKPLKLAIWLGVLSVLVGLIYALVILILKIIHPESFVMGWTSTIFMIIFFGGIQLLTIGVLGEYIGNLFDEAKDRPEYIISEKVNF